MIREQTIKFKIHIYALICFGSCVLSNGAAGVEGEFFDVKKFETSERRAIVKSFNGDKGMCTAYFEDELRPWPGAIAKYLNNFIENCTYSKALFSFKLFRSSNSQGALNYDFISIKRDYFPRNLRFSVSSENSNQFLSHYPGRSGLVDLVKKESFLIYLGFNTGEPFMEKAIEFEFNSLARNCKTNSKLNFVFYKVGVLPGAKTKSYFCYKGKMRALKEVKVSGDELNVSWLRKKIYSSISRLLNDPSEFYFIVHVKSHGNKENSIVPLTSNQIRKKTLYQEQVLEWEKLVLKNSIETSPIKRSFYSGVKNSLNPQLTEYSLIHGFHKNLNRYSQDRLEDYKTGLGGAKNLGVVGEGSHGVHEEELYDLVGELKESFDIKLWFQESCREDASTLRDIPDDLRMIFRRANGNQIYSSLDWTQFNPKDYFSGYGRSKNDADFEDYFGNGLDVLLFYDVQIDNINLFLYRDFIEQEDAIAESRLSILTKSLVNNLLPEVLFETDWQKEYPALISAANIPQFGSWNKGMTLDPKPRRKEKSIWTSSTKDSPGFDVARVQFNEHQSYLYQAYLLRLWDTHNYSVAHKSVFNNFYHKFGDWTEDQLETHKDMARLFKNILGNRVFQFGPIREDLPDFDSNPYLEAPYSMLMLIVLGEDAFDIFNFPTGFSTPLTREQNEKGISFSPKGLLYLVQKGKNKKYSNIDELGVNRKNLPYFVKKASILEDYVFLSSLIKKFVTNSGELFLLVKEMYSLSNKHQYSLLVKSESNRNETDSRFQFIYDDSDSRFKTPFYGEQGQEFYFVRKSRVAEIDLNNQYANYSLPIKSYLIVYTFAIEHNLSFNEFFLAEKAILEHISGRIVPVQYIASLKYFSDLFTNKGINKKIFYSDIVRVSSTQKISFQNVARNCEDSASCVIGNTAIKGNQDVSGLPVGRNTVSLKSIDQCPWLPYNTDMHPSDIVTSVDKSMDSYFFFTPNEVYNLPSEIGIYDIKGSCLNALTETRLIDALLPHSE